MASDEKNDLTVANVSKKVCVIAGYGAGMGHNVALKFLEKGFAVALLSRMGDKKKDDKVIPTTVDTIKSNFDETYHKSIFPIKTDLSKKESIDDAFKYIATQIQKKVSVLVYNAVVMDFSTDVLNSKEACSFDYFGNHYAVGVSGFLHCIWHCMNNKDIRDDIVTVLLTGGGFGDPNVAKEHGSSNVAVLASVKAAQTNLVHCLAKTLMKNNVYIHEIRINVFVGSKAEWQAEKIANLYVEKYKQIMDAAMDKKHNDVEKINDVLFSTFPQTQ